MTVIYEAGRPGEGDRYRVWFGVNLSSMQSHGTCRTERAAMRKARYYQRQGYAVRVTDEGENR